MMRAGFRATHGCSQRASPRLVSSLSAQKQHRNLSVAASTSGGVSKRALLGSGAGCFLGGIAFFNPTGQRNTVAMAASSKSSEIEQVLKDPKWPQKFPFPANAFKRYDEEADSVFYDRPRYVFHIDDGAVGAITKHYAQVLPPSGNKDVALLDICSSWVSHYPPGYTAGRVAGLGMNGDELAKNEQLTEYAVRDLNEDPTLPYEDNSFDVITNVVSVDYLTQPMEVFKEMHRCLKPGGTAIMSFSNRCFPTKAIAIWTQTGDLDHVWIVGSYFHYSVPGGFTEPEAKDLSPGKGTDPMYVVYASKK